MNVYSYVIASDAGSAPNFEPPCATLAVCKPKIRKGAEIGDLVIAFSGCRLSPEPHSVRWAGVVSDKLTFSQYWDDIRFQGKKPAKSPTPDNIYKPLGNSLVQVPNQTHDSTETRKDTGGEYVLLFKETWYFGPAAPILPIEYEFRLSERARRNHRVNCISEGNWNRLRSWLDSNLPSTDTERAYEKLERKGSCR